MATVGRKRKTEQERRFDEWLGNEVSAARGRKRMSQRELAEALGIGAKRLYWYETGRCSVPLYLVEPLSRILGLSISTFVQKGHYCGLLENSCAEQLKSL